MECATQRLTTQPLLPPPPPLLLGTAGKDLTDYAGRTYMHVPTDKGVSLSADAPPPDSFLPKECIHTWTGHTKAVSSIKLFPGSGHLLLSGSMDTKVKVSVARGPKWEEGTSS